MSEENVDWEKVAQYLTPKPPLYCPHEPYFKQKLFLLVPTLEVLYGGKSGGGKAIRADTPVMTPKGPKEIQDLRVGQQVAHPGGGCSKVIGVYPQGLRPAWKISFSDGAEIVADEGHIWKYKVSGRFNKRDIEWRLCTTLQLVEMVNKAKAQSQKGTPRTNWPLVPLTEPVEFTIPYRNRDASLPIDPYTLGALLGDGCLTSDNYSFASVDEEILGWVSEGLEPHALKLRQSGEFSHNIVMADRAEHSSAKRDFKEKLKKLGVHGCAANSKSVPQEYMVAPLDVRRGVIQGLMDTDGYADSRGHASFVSVSKSLALDVQWIARSLGFKATMTEKETHYKDSDGLKVQCQNAFTVTFTGRDASELFRLKRKKDRCSAPPQQTGIRRVVDAERIEDTETVCIKVDHPDGMFIAGDGFVVTHNSDALLMAALQFVNVPGYSAILFRNSYSDLILPGALMDRAQEWLEPFVPEVRWSAKTYTWTFPSSATLTFGYLDKPDDHLRYKGMESQYIGFDEVTEIREKHYTYLFSRLRKPSTGPLSKVPTRVRSTCNPAPNWVRERFIENPVSESGQKRIFIPAGLEDNPFINKEDYLRSMEEMDPIERARLKDGDWYAESEDSKFKREWFKVISSDDVPLEAYSNIVRYWDLASTEPHAGNKDPDWTAGALVSEFNGVVFIHDIRRIRKDAGAVEDFVFQTAHEDGPSVKIRIEQEPGSSGKIATSHYSRHILPGFDFDGHPAIRSKETRVNSWLGALKRGHMLLVRPDGRNWIRDFIDEAVHFGTPGAAHDDQLDAVSGAYEVLFNLGGKGGSKVEIII